MSHRSLSSPPALRRTHTKCLEKYIHKIRRCVSMCAWMTLAYNAITGPHWRNLFYAYYAFGILFILFVYMILRYGHFFMDYFTVSLWCVIIMYGCETNQPIDFSPTKLRIDEKWTCQVLKTFTLETGILDYFLKRIRINFLIIYSLNNFQLSSSSANCIKLYFVSIIF